MENQHSTAQIDTGSVAADSIISRYSPVDSIYRDVNLAEELVAKLLMSLGINLTDPNFEGTPQRFTRYLLDRFTTRSELVTSLERDCKRAVFPSSYTGIVTLIGIRVSGICPHHLLPVAYSVSLGYIPKGKAIGLSKLARTTEIISQQPILQEDLTEELATILQWLLETDNVAVEVMGVHSCMSIRGVKQSDHQTITSTVRGNFYSEPQTRAEFFSLVRRGVTIGST